MVRPLFAVGTFLAGAVPLAAIVPPGTPLRPIALGVYAAVAVATVAMSYRAARRMTLDFEPTPCPPDAERDLPAPRPAPTTYRSPPRRVEARVRALVPPISGAWATLFVLTALAFPALVVPSLVALPRWLAVEVVLALWWLGGALALGHVLFHGTVAADDAGRLEDRGGVADGFGASHLGSGVTFGPEARSVLVALFAGVIGFVLIGWFLAELVFPALFFGAYAFLATATRAATRDRHDCRGHAARALLWGGIWSAIFTAPLAVVVALVHLVLAR